MSRKTESERLFEAFCDQHGLDCKPIHAGAGHTADYRLQLGSMTVVVEIKQIESRSGFDTSGCKSRTVGAHVRHKIAEAREQIRQAAAAGLPTILLIYNTVDPMQSFGTEPHDFICGMYGELTVRLAEGRANGSFHGRNAKLRHDTNTSFGGVGHLKRVANGAEVKVFENAYACPRLPFDALPPCIEVVRVEVCETDPKIPRGEPIEPD